MKTNEISMYSSYKFVTLSPFHEKSAALSGENNGKVKTIFTKHVVFFMKEARERIEKFIAEKSEVANRRELERKEEKVEENNTSNIQAKQVKHIQNQNDSKQIEKQNH